MLESIKRLLLATAFFAIVFLIIAATIAGDPQVTSDPVLIAMRKWIFDFQTLLTGILAVSAAIITVSQMQSTETADKKRHLEIMYREKRNNQIRVRLLITTPSKLDWCRGHIRKIVKAHGPTGDNSITEQEIEMLLKVGKLTLEALNRPEWTDVRELFDLRLSYAQDELLKLSHSTEMVHEQLRQIEVAPDAELVEVFDGSDRERLRQEWQSHLLFNARMMLDWLDLFFEGLRELYVEYDIPFDYQKAPRASYWGFK